MKIKELMESVDIAMEWEGAPSGTPIAPSSEEGGTHI